MQITKNLHFMTLRTEKESHFLDLITAAHNDFNPKNFAERRLVDEMATSTWRALRAAIMERSVYDHQDSTFHPAADPTPDGHWTEPNEDIFNIAMAHSPDRHAVVLAALARLETRFTRQFHAALRLLIALRNGSPPPAPEPPPFSPSAPNSPAPPTETRKESQPCNH